MGKAGCGPVAGPVRIARRRNRPLILIRGSLAKAAPHLRDGIGFASQNRNAKEQNRVKTLFIDSGRFLPTVPSRSADALPQWHGVAPTPGLAGRCTDAPLRSKWDD